MGHEKRRVDQVPGSALVQSNRDLEGTIDTANFYMLYRVVSVSKRRGEKKGDRSISKKAALTSVM